MRVRSGLRDHVFAWLMARVSRRYEDLAADRKTRLLQDLSGTVLEIGSGTGPNLRFAPGVERWLALEPNVWMHPCFREEARERRVPAWIITASAEEIPLPDESVDWALSTLVLCSVDGLDRALAEIRRVLRPGGGFIFMEHVAAPEGSWLRRLQEIIRPVWRPLADGCRPDRDTGSRIRAAGFDSVEIEAFRLSLPVVGPHVAGVAWKEGPPVNEPR